LESYACSFFFLSFVGQKGKGTFILKHIGIEPGKGERGRKHKVKQEIVRQEGKREGKDEDQDVGFRSEKQGKESLLRHQR
jgi:hypothetical protein